MLKFRYDGGCDNYIAHYYINAYPLKTEPNVLEASGTINGCREFYVRNVRTIINKEKAITPKVSKAYALITYGIQGSELRFKRTQKSLVSNSEKSLYIINSFEKEHKWPLTKTYPVECINKRMALIFFAGPRKWTTSPYLMSIWSLMLRLGRNSFIPNKLSTLNHTNLVKKLMSTAKKNGSNDAIQLRQTLPEWDNFMFLYKDLFGSNTRKYHWRKTHLNGYNDRPEGILKLINGTTGYKELSKKFFKLKKEKGLK